MHQIHEALGEDTSIDAHRRRVNSLRTGESSKVIQQLDLSYVPMEKHHVEEYEAFRRGSTNDRKMSTEYFREESKRIDAAMKQK
jgi:hypothetical protein